MASEGLRAATALTGAAFLARCLCGLLAAAPLAALAQDDHGDDRATATLLAIGPPMTGTLGDASDEDYFRIDLVGTASLTFSTAGATDTRGELQGGDGATLATDDNSGSQGHNFSLSADLEPGVYYLVVAGAAGNYAVTARLSGAADPGDTAAGSALLPLYNASDLARVKPQALLSTADSIRPADDADVYRIDVPRNDAEVTIRSAISTDVHARLLDSARSEIAMDGGVDSDGFHIETTLDAGIYYLEVHGHDAGAYRVIASASDPSCACAPPSRAADHGDYPEAATLLALGPPLTGTIADDADSDFFRIDLAGSATVTISTAGQTDTAGELRDGAGTVLASDGDSGPGGNFSLTADLEPGVYYVKVTGAAGDYAISAQLGSMTDHGDTAELSTLLTFYDEATLDRVRPQVLLSTAGAIDPAETDYDVFRVDIPAATVATFRSAGGTDTYARLRDSSLVEIASGDDDRDGNFRIELSLDAGIYYLEVGAHEAGNYRVLAFGDSIDCPCAGEEAVHHHPEAVHDDGHDHHHGDEEEGEEEETETAAEVFGDHISEQIVQDRCINCHVSGGASGNTRLVFRPSGAQAHESQNLGVFRGFVISEDRATLVLNKISATVSHGGGEQVPRGSTDFMNMERFLDLLLAELDD